MTGKREKPEDIVLKLRQVEVLQGHRNATRRVICAARTRFADIRDRDLGRDPWWWRNIRLIVWVPLLSGLAAFWGWVAAVAMKGLPL